MPSTCGQRALMPLAELALEPALEVALHGGRADPLPAAQPATIDSIQVLAEDHFLKSFTGSLARRCVCQVLQKLGSPMLGDVAVTSTERGSLRGMVTRLMTQMNGGEVFPLPHGWMRDLEPPPNESLLFQLASPEGPVLRPAPHPPYHSGFLVCLPGCFRGLGFTSSGRKSLSFP